MDRYISIPPDVIAIDPQTDKPMGEVLSFSWGVRQLFLDQRLIGALDVFTLIELRKKLMSAKHGDPPVVVTEEEWNAILPCIKRPAAFGAAFLYAGDAFFRAFTDATTKAPE